MEATRTEVHDAKTLAARLRALRAAYQRDTSTNARHIYWSAATRQWLGVEGRTDGNFNLGFYPGCPCRS